MITNVKIRRRDVAGLQREGTNEQLARLGGEAMSLRFKSLRAPGPVESLERSPYTRANVRRELDAVNEACGKKHKQTLIVRNSLLAAT